MIATVSPFPVLDRFSSGPDGIFIGNKPILTTHFRSNRERNPEIFFQRIIELLPDRYRQVVLKQKKAFIEIISFGREVQTQQRRSCYFDAEKQEYSTVRRAYATHTEGVGGELVPSLMDEYEIPVNKICIVLIAGLLHDIVEDYPGRVGEMMQLLEGQGFGKKARRSMLGLILRLSKPEEVTIQIMNQYGLHSRRTKGLENKSMDIARKIIEDILGKKDKIEEFWNRVGIEGYRAPRDQKLCSFLSQGRSEQGTVSYELNKKGFPHSITLDLYRFVQHTLYTWWKFQDKKSLAQLPEDFLDRIRLDLAAILQIVLGTDRNQKSSSKDWFSRAVMLIKLSDQLYNSWDNYYAVDSKTGKISTQYSKKVWQLLHRARMYERVCAMNGAGQNGSIFSLMKVVIDQLQYLLEDSSTSVSAPLVPAIPSAQMTD